jgi:hypothetical protein
LNNGTCLWVGWSPANLCARQTATCHEQPSAGKIDGRPVVVNYAAVADVQLSGLKFRTQPSAEVRGGPGSFEVVHNAWPLPARVLGQTAMEGSKTTWPSSCISSLRHVRLIGCFRIRSVAFCRRAGHSCSCSRGCRDSSAAAMRLEGSAVVVAAMLINLPAPFQVARSSGSKRSYSVFTTL